MDRLREERGVLARRLHVALRRQGSEVFPELEERREVGPLHQGRLDQVHALFRERGLDPAMLSPRPSHPASGPASG